MGGYLLHRHQLAEPHRAGPRRLPPPGAPCSAALAGKLSGGERKMLAMGRVLMLDPGVFLLDEPTANLAPRVAKELLDEHVRRRPGERRVGAHRRAAGPGRAGDLGPDLRPGRQGRCGCRACPPSPPANPDFIESFLRGARDRAVPSGET